MIDKKVNIPTINNVDVLSPLNLVVGIKCYMHFLHKKACGTEQAEGGISEYFIRVSILPLLGYPPLKTCAYLQPFLQSFYFQGNQRNGYCL